LLDRGFVEDRKMAEFTRWDNKRTEHYDGAMPTCSGFVQICKVHKYALRG
jgi:hypothetical protein